MPGYPFSEIRDRLDDWRLFNNMVDSPYYRDAVYERFSSGEYERRYSALRTKMRERGLDCVIVPGGPNHWSFGGGMLWLSGHWEWHAMANYVVFPLVGEPTLIYSMGGTHIEATRKESAIKDVRQSRGGRLSSCWLPSDSSYWSPVPISRTFCFRERRPAKGRLRSAQQWAPAETV